MTLTQLFHLLGEARRLSSHDEFVIIGSLSVLGISEGMEIPDAMAMSQDVDCYMKADPARVFDLVQALGEGSEYEAQTSFYLDAVSPDLPTLPDGWQTRLLKISKSSLTAWFLEPNDAAVSKYARGEPRDIRWIRAGVEAGIVSLPTVRYRFRETVFLDAKEQADAKSLYEADVNWFQALRTSPPSRPKP